MICVLYPIVLMIATIFSSPILYHIYYEVSDNAELDLGFRGITMLPVKSLTLSNITIPNGFFFPNTDGVCDRNKLHIVMHCSKGCGKSLHARQEVCYSQFSTLPYASINSCKCEGPIWVITPKYYVDEELRPYVVFTISGPVSVSGCKTVNGVRKLTCYSFPCYMKVDSYIAEPGNTRYNEFLEFH